MPRKKPVPAPEPLANPPLVRYYREGWRYGHLLSTKGETATIQPIAARNAATPRPVRVPVSDVFHESLGAT